MTKIMLAMAYCLFLSACSGSVLQKQKPLCEAEALIGGQVLSVQIYDVRKVANQTEYRAGYPFNWRWVSKNNFTRSTCSK
ncbi:phage exclusion lipoprotein Cor [Enterobacter vonholyi]|uniref:Cor protein n=1 Tax=Enterobacter vonholyi TaxID=2797505 RepID=A0ABU6DYV2_9ENTR|nr:cor protein [Enterobacter vonholyi]MEB6409134.1 cor protein [Enterobacter vonholyi]